MLLHSNFVLVLTFILYQLYLVLKNAINYGIAYNINITKQELCSHNDKAMKGKI